MDSFVAIGAVLVIERRRCLGKIKVANEETEVPCGAVYDSPARSLAQLFLSAGEDKVKYSISTRLDPHHTDPEFRPDEEWKNKIEGRNRTIYILETTCDHCQLCYRSNIDWDLVHKFELDKPRKEIEIPAEDSYAQACSDRDRLKHQLNAAYANHATAEKILKEIRYQHQEAISRVHSFSRVHQEKVTKRYSTEVTKPRDIFKDTEKKAKDNTPLTPGELRLQEIRRARKEGRQPLPPISLDEI